MKRAVRSASEIVVFIRMQRDGLPVVSNSFDRQ